MTDATTKRPRKAVDHLVILIHGINTYALWFDQVGKTLTKAGFTVAALGYGRFPVLRFLLPFDPPKQKAADKIIDKIRLAIALHKPNKVSIVAHSFGTYIVGRILQQEWDRRWHRIIFCGSVVPDEFPFEQVIERFESPIVNEIGTRDFWPAIAKSVTWGYGSVGSHGFHSAAVIERWHAGFAHSDFLTPEFCNKYWVPFLREGTVVEGDQAAALPRWVGVVTLFPWRLFIAVAVLVALIALPQVYFGVPARLAAFIWENLPNPQPAEQKRDNASLREAPPLPEPKWEKLPPGTRYANANSDAVPVFSRPDESSAKEITSLRPGDTISPTGGEHGIERAIVNGERWLRFKTGGEDHYVPERKLKELGR